MPKWKIHFVLSRKRTKGNSYEKLHKWIDKNYEVDKDVNHRNNGRHIYTEENRKFIYLNFGGDEAVSEWLFHIAIDNLNTSVINDWKTGISLSNFHKFGFGDKNPDNNNGFIYYAEDELNEEEIEEEFSEDF